MPVFDPEDQVLSNQTAERVANTPTEQTDLAAVPLETRLDPSQTASQPAAQGALLPMITDSLDEDGAFDIVTIPLAGKSSEADSMVIASGRSTRHVAAVADKLIERLKQDAGVVPRSEGKETADWVLIDAGDVIVHLFRPEVRDFYQLEKMWLPAPDKTARAATP